MTVFVLIFIFTGILFSARKLGVSSLENFKNCAHIATGMTFIFTGISHFIAPDTFMKLMPPPIPEPLLMIYISGFFEILGGIGLIFAKKTARRLRFDSAASSRGFSGECLRRAGKRPARRFYELFVLPMVQIAASVRSNLVGLVDGKGK